MNNPIDNINANPISVNLSIYQVKIDKGDVIVFQNVRMSQNEENSIDKKYALDGVSLKIKNDKKLLSVEGNMQICIYIYIYIYRTGSGKI